MLSNVGEALPVRAEPAGEAEAECVCAVEAEAIDVDALREAEEDARYRHPVGTATRVAGGPPDGFERPPGSAASYGHAWPGGFDRAPGTADDTPTPSDTSP